MKLSKLTIYIIGLLMVLFISGCETNNNPEEETTDNNIQEEVDINESGLIPTIFLESSTLEVDTNNETLSIVVNVFDQNNNPYPTGKVSIIRPDKVQEGIDVGSFNPSITADVVEGKATFTYTAPSDIQSLYASGDTYSQFQFYHSDQEDILRTLTINYNLKSNQIIDISYDIEFNSSDDNVTFSLESRKQFTIDLREGDGDLVDNEKINYINLTIEQSSIMQIFDSNDNTYKSTITDDKNHIITNLNSNQKSGLVVIRINTNFIDINGEVRDLERFFNVVVLSGPPTAISFSYISTEHDADNAQFIEKWVISVSDKYNNHVNTAPAISMGAIFGYADNGSGNYLYYTPDNVNGTLSSNGTFTAASEIFNNVDSANDILLTFGNGYTYNASGKWDFTLQSGTMLNLLDEYYGETTSNLGFAVGHNYRQDKCEFGKEWTGRIKSSDGENIIINSLGKGYIDIEYDYYLTGKDIMLWTNLIGDHNETDQTARIGEAQEVTLRAKELTGGTSEFSCETTSTHTFLIDIKETSEAYRNGNFAYDLDIRGDGTITSIETSMDDGIEGCDRGYIIIGVQGTMTEDCDDGIITISDVVVSDEF